MIYVFGDSHRSFFTDTHPGSRKVDRRGTIISYWLGAGTAHNFYKNRHNLMMAHLQYANVDDGVIITAGEIDCRWHIPRIHLETGERIPILVENTVDRFMQSLLELKEAGFKVIAWGPHPTRDLQTLEKTMGVPDYSGDQHLRNWACWAYNAYLCYLATEAKIPFSTVFYNIIKDYDNYTVYDELYRDSLHLNQTLWPATQKFIGEAYDNYTNFQ